MTLGDIDPPRDLFDFLSRYRTFFCFRNSLQRSQIGDGVPFPFNVSQCDSSRTSPIDSVRCLLSGRGLICKNRGVFELQSMQARASATRFLALPGCCGGGSGGSGGGGGGGGGGGSGGGGGGIVRPRGRPALVMHMRARLRCC